MFGLGAVSFAPINRMEDVFALSGPEGLGDQTVVSFDELPMEFTVEIKGDDLRKLIPQQFDPSGLYELSFYSRESVPARRHKRRRTQKKWIRRFGYKMAWFYTEIPNCEYKDSETGLLLVNHGEMKRRRKNAPREAQ